MTTRAAPTPAAHRNPEARRRAARPPVRRALTAVQVAVVSAVWARQEQGERGPTIAELASDIGRCVTRAVELVEALEDRGMLSWPRSAGGRRVPRAIRVIPAVEPEVETGSLDRG